MISFIITSSHAFTSIRSFSTKSIKASIRVNPQNRCRHGFHPSKATQYTINDDICAPIDPSELKKIVQKHCKSLDRFLENKPIARHTQQAFDDIYPLIDTSKKVILDSGCGTGRSTLLLGEMFPDHTVIGIDRSFVRLSKNTVNRKNILDADDDDQEVEEKKSSSEESLRPFQAISSNTLLVRAELTDFWRCCLNSGWDISHHYILYPNPYPKKNRVKKRFYAHPSFPLILKIGGEITLRSNWEGYLKEFANSVTYAHDLYDELDMEDDALVYLEDALSGPKERLDKSIAYTNFEKKYDNVGEKTYELKLRGKSA